MVGGAGVLQPAHDGNPDTQLTRDTIELLAVECNIVALMRSASTKEQVDKATVDMGSVLIVTAHH